jgi:hypothetical protein
MDVLLRILTGAFCGCLAFVYVFQHIPWEPGVFTEPSFELVVVATLIYLILSQLRKDIME